MGDEKLYITAQGRLPRDLTRAQRAALGAYAALFSRAERQYIADTAAGRDICKSGWLKRYGITGRQFNAVERSARGKIDSQLANLQGYLVKQVSRIRSLERSRIRVREQIAAWKKARAGENRDRKLDDLYRRLRGVERGLALATNRKAEIEEQIRTNRPSICLGSRRLFRKQFNLKENGYTSHREWRGDWQSARRAQFFILGSKTETAGCQGCVMTLDEEGRLSLTIRLPNALEEEHGKYLTISDIEIGYGLDAIKVADALNLRGRKNPARFLSEITDIPDRDGLAVNYRFVRDDKRGWRVLISMEKPNLPAVTTDVARGAIGVDLNADHLAVCEIDHEGNHVRSWSVPLPRGVRATSRQNATAIATATNDLVRHARQVGKPLVIEKLDFAAKKAGLQKRRNTKYNAMLSTFSYRLFEQFITRQGLLLGVQVRRVNPAWTSFVGRIKYTPQTRGRSHEAAAMVIARRGRGHRDRLPHESRQTFRCGETRTFRLPEDRRKDRCEALYPRANRMFGKWLAAQISELRLSIKGTSGYRGSGEKGQSRTVSMEEASLIPY